MDSDFQPAAEAIAARWQNRTTPFPDLLQLLLDTYTHENQRRDLDRSGEVDEQEFVQSHASVIEAFGRMPEQARAFIARAAGGFFDVLDLNGDGELELADLEAYARAYGKPTAGFAPIWRACWRPLICRPIACPRRCSWPWLPSIGLIRRLMRPGVGCFALIRWSRDARPLVHPSEPLCRGATPLS